MVPNLRSLQNNFVRIQNVDFQIKDQVKFSVSSTLHAKMAMPDLLQCTHEIFILSKMWKTPAFFWLKMCWSSPLFLISKKCASHFCREPANNNSLKKQTHNYLIHTWTDNAFKGSIVNRALTSLHWRSLEVTLTVPLIWKVSAYLERLLYGIKYLSDVVLGLLPV